MLEAWLHRIQNPKPIVLALGWACYLGWTLRRTSRGRLFVDRGLDGRPSALRGRLPL